jgi:hypothetical protein
METRGRPAGGSSGAKRHHNQARRRGRAGRGRRWPGGRRGGPRGSRAGNGSLSPARSITPPISRVRLPHTAREAGHVEGKSSPARVGLGIHLTAPAIDPSFDPSDEPANIGSLIRLEIWNIGALRIRRRDLLQKWCQVRTGAGGPGGWRSGEPGMVPNSGEGGNKAGGGGDEFAQQFAQKRDGPVTRFRTMPRTRVVRLPNPKGAKHILQGASSPSPAISLANSPRAVPTRRFP